MFPSNATLRIGESGLDVEKVFFKYLEYSTLEMLWQLHIFEITEVTLSYLDPCTCKAQCRHIRR